MKKFVVFIMSILVALSVVMSASALTLSGEALWAISTEQHVMGIIDPTKVENYFGPQEPPKPYVRGFLENGLVREKGLQAYTISASGQLGGFTTLKTTVTIFPQFEEVVYDLVTDKCGYEPNSVTDYILATMYFTDEYVGHVFIKTNVPKFHVGTITITDKKDTIELYMGDFDLDGYMELGFAPGWTPCQPAPKKCCGKWTVKCITVTQICYIKQCFQKTKCK